MKKKKGFTIIEVLVTSAIILILFALGLKLVFGAIQRARDHAAAATLSNINSMYRMSASFLYLDANSQFNTTAPIALPTNSVSAKEATLIETQMHLAFSDLKTLRYTLVDKNGIEAEGGVTIIYYPYEDKPYEFYTWADGAITRTYKKTQSQIK